jgi:hypothetical protein
MQELSARAALVSAPEVSGGLTTSVSREEVAEALRVGDTPPDLILDVTRFTNGDPAETRNLVVAWERADLEELLRQSESDRVILTFDSEAIREAMEADVEAHGIREKALVLAVAAVAATGGAASASAQVSPDDRAVSKATSVGQVEIPYLSHGTLTPEAAAPATGGVSPDDRAVSMAAPATGAESEAAAAEIPYLSHGTLTPADAAAAAAGPSMSPDDRAVSMAAPATAAESEAAAAGASLSPDDRAVSMAAPAPADVAADDSGISISAPSPTTAVGIGAAVALAITGAAFAVAGRRRVTPA